jgi:hypothetical protein
VFTTYRKLVVDLNHIPLIKISNTAYQTTDVHRRALSDSTSREGRCGLPAKVMRRISDAAQAAPFLELRFIRAVTAVFVSFMIFEGGEAGAILS